MGYSWVYIGDATIPDANRQAWLDADPSPRDHGEALTRPDIKDWNLHTEPDELEPCESVAEVLDELASDEGAIVSFEEGPIVVRLLADKSEDSWLTYRKPLVGAFLALRDHGGKGELVVVGYDDGPDDGFRIVCDESGTTVTSLDANGVARVRASAGYREAHEAFEAYMRQEYPELFQDED